TFEHTCGLELADQPFHNSRINQQLTDFAPRIALPGGLKRPDRPDKLTRLVELAVTHGNQRPRHMPKDVSRAGQLTRVIARGGKVLAHVVADKQEKVNPRR